jgi:hypothetical protein
MKYNDSGDTDGIAYLLMMFFVVILYLLFSGRLHP